MKIYKTLFLIFFCFGLEAKASSNFPILSWHEQTNLTKTGKTSEIFIQAKAFNLLEGQNMTSFTINFDKRRNIKIDSVICENKRINYLFSNNSLNIKFPKPLPNNSHVAIYFSFEESYKKINQFLREEIIDIPAFASGAEVEIVLNFPGYLESATLNKNVTKSGNSFIYKNIVPQNGVREMIKLTPSRSVWDVVVKAKIGSDKVLKDLTVSVPNYFKNGEQEVENLIIKPSLDSYKQSWKDNNNIFKFNNLEKEISIESRARISVGKNNRGQAIRNPAQYLEVSDEDIALLSPMLEQIKRHAKYQDLPLYAKIGKFVNEFIKYDLSYVNKLPEIKEILQNPVGVCTEYAKLYNALARIAKIPAVIVDGAACGQKDECRGHAWNIIYQDNRWIMVDPTWDLMSGIVSSSHIYFSDYGKDEIEVRYLENDGAKVNSKIEFEMKEIPYDLQPKKPISN